MIVEKPKCDKCRGRVFKIESDDTIKFIKASEYFEKERRSYCSASSADWLDIPKHKATCGKCGKVYKY